MEIVTPRVVVLGIFRDGGFVRYEFGLHNGNSLLYDYPKWHQPQLVIYFALNVTNQDFNTSSATVQITVSDGVPCYMAVLVDSTDYSDCQLDALQFKPRR